MGVMAANRRQNVRFGKIAAAAAFGALAFLGLPAQARAEAPDGGNAPYAWDYIFPIWGHKLAARGIRFPLPFGVGVNYVSIVQDVTIKSVEVAVNDREYVNLDKIVKFDKVSSSVQGLGARADLWVLPFLNVYGLANYAISSDTDVLLSQPFPLRAGAQQSGYGGGFGLTGAFGFWGIFATLDANWTWNKLEKLDAPVRTFLLTPRVGKKLKLNSVVTISPWVGAMRQEIDVNTSGSISLSDTIGEPSDEFKQRVGAWYDGLSRGQQAVVSGIVSRLDRPGDPTIHYRLDKALTDPWNMLIGAEADFNQRFQIRTEVGFFGRTQLIFGLCYRFGI
jgi:hypothetical protein